MSYAVRMAKCLHCGQHFVCGDCIPNTCPNCLSKGHDQGFATNCRACARELDESIRDINCTSRFTLGVNDTGQDPNSTGI